MRAFKEITLSKLLAIYWSIQFTIFAILALLNPENVAIFSTVSTATIAIIAGYFGKSGYEYYSRNRYTYTQETFSDGELNYDE